MIFYYALQHFAWVLELKYDNVQFNTIHFRRPLLNLYRIIIVRRKSCT